MAVSPDIKQQFYFIPTISLYSQLPDLITIRVHKPRAAQNQFFFFFFVLKRVNTYHFKVRPQPSSVRLHFHPQESQKTHSGHRETHVRTTGQRRGRWFASICSFTINALPQFSSTQIIQMFVESDFSHVKAEEETPFPHSFGFLREVFRF